MSQDTSLDDESIKLAEAAAVPLPSDVEDSNDDEEVESAVTQQVESTKRRKSPKRYSKLGDDFDVSGLPVELRDDPKMYKYWKQRHSLFHRTKMSNIKTDRGLSYTIPVDSMDLKYLSKYVSSTGMLPLWTKTRLNGEAGYCQVQILAQNDEECYSEPADTYECHICNLHVPVTCSKEHNDSECHKTIKNIYQIVLEKLSKQMDTSIVKHDEKIDKDAYYCVPCSKIIKKENKDKHESSEFHAKSNKDTIIISEFYKIINEDKSPTDNIILNEERLTQDSDLEPVYTKSYIENNNYAITLNKLNNNYLDIGHDESTDLPTYANKLAKPGPSKIQPPNDNKIQPPNDEKAETFKDYLEAMIKKYKLKVNLPVMTSEDIYLESSNGETVIVCPEHFQSYRQSKNRVYCQLCNMWISQDTKPHDVTENHVGNIFKPINENFARTVGILI